ncbi:hypothetical protein [Kitasatospora sp. GAS1066B]|uniref:hypothetical protein n=1 Tax=Kitasatospora sp. GAS1066B TaxID=3156271 RepID=UPI003514C3C0
MDFDLSTGLAELVGSPPQQSVVDVAAAVRQGRSRRRRRRLGVAAASLAFAVGVSGLALALPGQGHGVPAAAPTTTAPADLPPDTGHDPLTTEVQFGWLPDWARGSDGIGYSADYQGPSPQAFAMVRGNPARGFSELRLTLLPAGQVPDATKLNGRPAQRSAAPQVNGGTAYWLTPSADPRLPTDEHALRWLTSSGRWAELQGQWGEDAGATAVVLRVAAGVTYGKWAVPLPVRLTGLPADFKVALATLAPSMNGSDWTVAVAMTVGNSLVTINVGPSLPLPPSGSPYPGKSIHNGGYPGAPGCITQAGLDACVDSPPGYETALQAVGGVHGVADRLVLLGGDRGNWTTEVTN